MSCGGTCIRSCACIGAIYTSRCTSPAEETRSEKLAALVVRFTTLFSGPLSSSSVSTRHVFARAGALATREYDSLNRIGRMIIMPWMRSSPGFWYVAPLFFFLFLFFFAPSSIRSERDAKFNLIRRTISLHSLSSVNSRFDRIIGGGGGEMKWKRNPVKFVSIRNFWFEQLRGWHGPLSLLPGQIKEQDFFTGANENPGISFSMVVDIRR